MVDEKLVNEDAGQEEEAGRAAPPTSHFRTFALPQAERFEAWRRSIGVFLDVSRPDALADRPFDAAINSYLVDSVIVGRCRAGAQQFTRAPRRIAGDGLDHYMIQVFRQGGVEMRRGNRSIEHHSGTLLGFDLCEQLDSFNCDFDLLYAMIPRRLLGPKLAHPDSVHGVAVLPDIGAGPIAARFLEELHAMAPRLSARECEVTANAFIDMVALAFSGANLRLGDGTREVRHAALLLAQAAVRDNLHQPEFGPEWLAGEIGLSRTRLYALFEPIGGVASYIREMRLRRAFSLLMSPRHAHRQVAQIGYDCGFSSSAAFARAFRARFGGTPREMRHKGKGSDHARASLGEVGDRNYEDWIATLA